MRDWLDNNGFTLVDTPILTPSAAEGTTTLFKTDFHGEDAFLAQTGQLYNEANIFAVGKTYCFGPTFHAEKSKTRRHLQEFWMVEPEIAFCKLEDLLEIEEQYISYIVQTTLRERAVELKLLERGADADCAVRAIDASHDLKTTAFSDQLDRLMAVWQEDDKVLMQMREETARALLHVEQRNLLAQRLVDQWMSRMSDQPVPLLVRSFLIGPWAQVVAESQLNCVKGSSDPQGYLAVVEQLIWSVQPWQARRNPVRLVEMIPEMLCNAARRPAVDQVSTVANRTVL